MAAFSVAFDGTRIVDASSTTGWTAETATPTAEPDFFYQGAGSISCTVKTSENGMYYTSASTDMTTPRVWLAKVLATNKDVLDGNGLVLRIGSATTAYYQYNNVFSATTYPIAGGWQIVAIDPNVSQWRSSTTGSPSLSAIIYWAIRADFSATSKSQNVAMDAIDYVTNGTGLTGTGGDGASADGTFTDFLTADEGTANNRWGVIRSQNGILFITGVLTIGTATETDFTDSNRVLVFPDQRVTTGFCGIDFGLQNASSVISISNCVFNGRGALYSSDDTRPDYEVSSTSGTLSITGSTFNTYRRITLNSKCTLTTCTFISGGDRILADGAVLNESSVSGYAGTANTSAVIWNDTGDPDGNFDNMSFTMGSTSTHAIEFGTSSPTTMTLRGIAFSGYSSSNNVNDSTLHIKRTTGTVTINLIGCSGNISYRTDGATVVLVADPVTVLVNVKDNAGSNLQNARVLLKAASGGPFPFEAAVSITRSGSTATVSHTAHAMDTNDKVVVVGADQQEYNGVFSITKIDDNSYSYTVSGTPATPATGSIRLTFAALSGLTDASGNISASRVYPSDQPVSGWVRKQSGTPYFRTSLLGGTVDNTTGYTANTQMILDE